MGNPNHAKVDVSGCQVLQVDPTTMLRQRRRTRPAHTAFAAGTTCARGCDGPKRFIGRDLCEWYASLTVHLSVSKDMALSS